MYLREQVLEAVHRLYYARFLLFPSWSRVALHYTLLYILRERCL